MKVEVSAQAEQDLEGIADHIARDNPVRALSFIRDLREKCLGLADYPHGFPVVERYAHLAVRRRVHGKYLIFYRVDPDRITILHILHGASDYHDLLGLD